MEMKNFWGWVKDWKPKDMPYKQGTELKPLTDEDMARYGSDDVADAYAKLHGGKNPNRMRTEPMTDDELYDFYGIR